MLTMTRPFYVRELERHYFKRTPDGWAYTVPGLRSVHEKWTYLVNDAQKAQLLQRLSRCRVAWMVFVPVLLLLAGLSTWKNYDDIDALSGAIGMQSGGVIGIIFFVLLFLFVRFAVPGVRLLVVRPILRHTVPSKLASPSTGQGFWQRQLSMVPDIAQKSSSRLLVLACIAFAWVFVTSLREALSASNGYISLLGPLFGMLAGATCTAVYGAALYLKLKAGRSQE